MGLRYEQAFILCLMVTLILVTSSPAHAYKNTPFRDTACDGPSFVQAGKTIPVTVILKDANWLLQHKLRDVTIYEDLNFNDKLDYGEHVLRKHYDPPLVITQGWWHETYYVSVSDLPSRKTKGVTKLAIRLNDTDEDSFFVRFGYPLPHLESWYAGDMHVHSWYTDVYWPPEGEYGPPVEAIASAARAFGLDFVILTDHVFTGWPGSMGAGEWLFMENESQRMSSSTFLMLPGVEILCETAIRKILGAPEVLVLTPDRFVSAKPYNPQSVIDRTHEAGGLAFIAHPASQWSSFEGVRGYDGIEVWNGEWDSSDDWALRKWDELLRAEVNPMDGFCIGIGNSDAHELNELGKARTYLYLPYGLTGSGIREALRGGRAVFSDGPLLVFDFQNCGTVTRVGGFRPVPQNTLVTLNFEWSSNELYGEIDRVEIRFDGHLIGELHTRGKTGSSTWEIDVSDKAVGSLHYIRTVGYTERGNKCYTNPIWIKIGSPDVEPPAVSISYPPSYVARRSITVEWTALDLYTGIERCEVYLNDALQGMPDSNSWTFDGLADGNYEVKIVAYDYAGNLGSYSAFFRVDATPPPIPVLKGVSFNGNTLTFEWSSVFDPSGVTYMLQIASDPEFGSLQLTRTGLTTNTYAVTSSEALPSGTYYWRVKATDGVGNFSWSEIESFEVPTPIKLWLQVGIIAVLVVVVGIIAVLYIRR